MFHRSYFVRTDRKITADILDTGSHPQDKVSTTFSTLNMCNKNQRKRYKRERKKLLMDRHPLNGYQEDEVHVYVRGDIKEFKK